MGDSVRKSYPISDEAPQIMDVCAPPQNTAAFYVFEVVGSRRSLRRRTRQSGLTEATWLLFILLLLPRFALADTNEARAQALFEEGVELFAAEQYSRAIHLFSQSFDTFPRASTLFNLGMCQRALSQNLEAIQSFKRLLTSEDMGATDEVRQKTEAALAAVESLVGRLRLEGAPDGAEVFINDGKVAETPLDDSVYLNPGLHAVRVTKENHIPFETEVRLAPAEEVTLGAALLRTNSHRPPRAETDSRHHQNANEKEPSSAEEGAASATSLERARRRRILLISGLVSCGLGVVAGGIGIYYHNKLYEDVENGTQAARLWKESWDMQYAKRYTDIEQNALPRDRAGITVGYAVGGALLTAGTVLLTLGATDRDARETSVSASPGGFVVSF